MGGSTNWVTMHAVAVLFYMELVAMNDYVAVEVGARLDLIVSLEENGGTGLRVPVGYGGLRAFF